MQLAELIDALSRPSAYADEVDAVEVLQTHISVVFLAGRHAYKIKKPVKLGFLDFSTLALRRHFCDEEVRLNARLAAEVYDGVVPIVQRDGQLQVEAAGEPVEWAVKMRRLPDEATLEHRLARGEVSDRLVRRIARRVAEFHAQAARGPRISAMGRFDVVARNARENFQQARANLGQAISRAVFERLSALTDGALEAHRDLIERRAARDVPCDTHGDLRLDHVYLLGDDLDDVYRLGDNLDDAKLLIIDCIEFNEEFRFADPVADIAFLMMDLKHEHREKLAAVLGEAYFDAAGDDQGRRLLPLYTSYRAAVRGKVEGLKHAEAEVPAAERAEAPCAARGYWLLALGNSRQRMSGRRWCSSADYRAAAKVRWPQIWQPGERSR